MISLDRVRHFKGGGKITTMFYHLAHVRVSLSKIFDHKHGQNFKIAGVKWSKLAIIDHDRNLRIAVVKWSKLVNFDR